MPSCCIRQCSARKNINRPELTLHRFPVNEIGRKKWLEVIGIENINPQHKMWYVCSMHFDASCFNRTLDVTRLRVGAIPSLFLQPTSACHLQPSTSSVMVADKSSERECSEQIHPPEVNLDIAVPVAKIPQQNEKIKYLTEKCEVLQKKVRKLNEMVRRRDKKIARFSDLIRPAK